MNELEPSLKLSPRTRDRMKFVDKLMSTKAGRIVGVLGLATILGAGGCVLQKKLGKGPDSPSSSQFQK